MRETCCIERHLITFVSRANVTKPHRSAKEFRETEPHTNIELLIYYRLINSVSLSYSLKEGISHRTEIVNCAGYLQF
jgi:hypothetical protein